MLFKIIKKLLPTRTKRFIKNLIYLCQLKINEKQKSCKLIVGSGSTFQKGWVSTDIDCLNLLNTNDWERFFSKRKIDVILAEHVWEHLTFKEGIIAAKNCFKYLKKNGYVRVAVQDGLNPNSGYINWVKPGGIGPGAEDHKILYTYKKLKNVFKKAGFKVKLLEYFDEQKKFHYVHWDPRKGMINRSKRFDKRNKGGKLNYTSIILDAIK
jgi:predicted SAM-dependent methyltransferase